MYDLSRILLYSYECSYVFYIGQSYLMFIPFFFLFPKNDPYSDISY